jgi:hypothetical protein
VGSGTRDQFRDQLAGYAEYDAELRLRLSMSCETAEPDNAIVHVGRVLEALLRDYWVRSPEISGRPSRTANLDVLITKSLVAERLETIRVHAEVLQKMRNLAAHSGSAAVGEGDAADAVRRLLIILYWFRQERQSLADATGSAGAGGDHAPASVQQPPQPRIPTPARGCALGGQPPTALGGSRERAVGVRRYPGPPASRPGGGCVCPAHRLAADGRTD